MKEVAAQLVTVVAPLTEFVQGLQRQRLAAAQRQQAAMAAGAPMIKPAVAVAVQSLCYYNCNQPGHLAKDCPKPRAQGGSAGPSQIPLAAPTAAAQGRVAMVMDTGATEIVTPAATEIGPDEYMAAAMFKPGTIGVIRHVQRITEESDLGPWRPGFEDLPAPVALEKSEFFLSEISFLGYIVTVYGLNPDPRKVAAVQEAPAPVTLTQVRAFLGLTSYYRRFIKGFAGIAKPLTNLLKKEEQLIWTPECEATFQALKEALTSAPVLARPDPTRRFALYTDWQPQAISAVLTQHGADGREHVIEYASKTLSQVQANYEACKGECLAVVWGILHFRPYLYGQKFLLWRRWQEHFIELSVCLVGVRVTWTQHKDHRQWAEYLELLLIQAWRTEVEGDLLGFLFGSVRTDHSQPISHELTIPLAQLADDLPLKIISQSDDNPVPHVLTQTLAPYLQWSACLEEPGNGRNPPSQRRYLDPREIVDLAFFQDRTASENEEVKIEAEDESSEEEEEVKEKTDEEETPEEETPEEGSYSEHSEGEQSEEEAEEEQDDEEEEEDQEELVESEYEGFEEEVRGKARAQA
ncbi:hypothetical protein CBR_g159 [Chara braunii]|uniref:CCHC-type domain-containing protein n=1 Tax=Chara braunii TaxID=69332 RepID=A0A388JLR3_CHABU|nr:hypothetical protein CBR_g159 [Chara braunii]|eukprot:GBG58759.1 hypothetical protein CBR_g159 [Chara braunii]